MKPPPALNANETNEHYNNKKCLLATRIALNHSSYSSKTPTATVTYSHVHTQDKPAKIRC